MKKVKDFPIEERPRERLLLKGAKSLSDADLLAILLGRGTSKNDVFDLSRQIVKKIDEKGLEIKPEDLKNIPGIGNAKATAIVAALEFARRRIKPEGLKIKFPADVLPLIQHFGDRKQEHFLSITINGANEVMNLRVITIGLVNRSPVHPREVFADAISERASAIIVAHNHPEGCLEPSKEDIATTNRLLEAGNILGIDLLDHIIFNSKTYFSFAENDFLGAKQIKEA